MKKILYALLGLSTCLIITFVYLAFNPQHLINKHTLQYVNDKYLQDLSVQWDKVDIEVINKSFFKKSISLQGEDFCSQYENHKICLEKLKVTIDLNLSSLSTLTIKEFILDDKIIQIDAQSKEDNLNSELSINDQLASTYELLQSLKNYIPKSYSLSLDNTSLVSQERITTLKGSINSQKIDLSIKTKNHAIHLQLKTNTQQISGEIDLKTPQISSHTDISFNLDKDLKLDLLSKVDLLQLDKDIKQKLSNKISFRLGINYTEEIFQLTVSQIDFKIKEYVSSLSIPSCEIKHLYRDSDRLHFNCAQMSIHSSTKNNPKLKNTPYAQDFTFLVDISSYIEESIHLDDQSPLGELSIKLKNKKAKGWNAQASSTIEFELNQGQLKFNPKNLDWKFNIENFTEVVNNLKGGPLAIPSPLNSLEGAIQFSSQEKVTLKNSSAYIPFHINLDLDRAANNQVKIKSTGALTYPLEKGNPLLELQATIEKLYLYLPEIDPIRGIPPIKRDERISGNFKNPPNPSTEASSKQSGLDYKISLKTKKKDSIRIYYYLFSPYLPLSLDVLMNTDKLTYTLSVHEKMKIEYLKRTLTLNTLKLTNDQSPPLDLEVLYQTGGYDIFLNVVGDLESSRLLLTSNPTVTREDIISLLIYGRKSSDISSFEKENVGGTEAAIVDRALGLFSIWAFASTPIDSVSYDPSTKTYSAQIALPGGVNFAIGTDWDRVSILSFRKRLNDTWSIVTSYLPASQDEESKENILLQKEISF